MSTVGVILSTMGLILSTVGVKLSTVENTRYCEGYHDTCGDIMSTVGVFSTVRGTQITKDLFPMVLNTPTVLMISPTYIMTSPQY